MKFTFKQFSLYPVLFTVCSFMPVEASEPANSDQEKISDGPYINIINEKNIKKYDLTWLCDGKKHNELREISQDTMSFNSCGLSAKVSKADQYFAISPSSYNSNKIAAISDIHGQIDLMKNLLSQHGITNKAGNWSYQQGHLVITGDVFDRGDKVTEILWFLFELEKQAQSAGGKLHLLLGNHEVMVLTDDLRYLSDKYRTAEKLLNKSMTELYAKGSVLGDWLRSKNVVIKINDLAFLHGGLHPEIAAKQLSLAQLNFQFRQHLNSPSNNKAENDLGEYLHGTDGPIWYRGYFNTETPTNLTQLTEFFEVSKFVVGHTSQTTIETRLNNQVIAIDSSIKNGVNGELLIIENNQFYRGLQDGKKVKLSLN
ncbi:MAG: metallophosphoesterase [Colwelliaceae bacterium]|nr:metallophosphoesterase [Colwelliaceae bacterium]